MKYLLVGFWLFSIPVLAQPAEQRLTAIHPSDTSVSWDEKTSRFPLVAENIERKGSLTFTRIKQIESFHPYDTDGGRATARPAIIGDLVYESLMLADPLGRSETMYPLIARALRVPEDLSYVIFEIDPSARFQDGSTVTGADVLFSLEVFKDTSRDQRAKLDSAIASAGATGNEVRIDLKTTGFASRRAIMQLAAMKIVKPNTTGATDIGGIRTRFTATGPYRLTQLGRSRLSLIIDPSYWGRSLSTRRGFFNFRVVEIIAHPDEAAARLSIANETANFHWETQANAVATTGALLKQKNRNFQHIEQNMPAFGERQPVLAFNIQSATVADPKVRQAILLAYDFESINQLHYAGALKRPTSLLEDGPFAPRGEASDSVKALMSTCTAPAAAAFESGGHAQYAQIGDKRLRLLTAMRLLQEAGLKMENGVIKRVQADGTTLPMHLRLLVKDSELRPAYMFRADLLRLGVLVQISTAEGEAFRIMRQTQEFDLVSGHESVLDSEGRPSPERLESRALTTLPCAAGFIARMENSDPVSETYRDNAEALARVHQNLTLSIFTGAPMKKDFFIDSRLNLPSDKASPEEMHMYGYWLDHPPIQLPWNGYPPFIPAGGCMDIGCLFNGIR